MKIKLDENLGPSVKVLFTAAGHDCHLTREEGLGGALDDDILRAAIVRGAFSSPRITILATSFTTRPHARRESLS